MSDDYSLKEQILGHLELFKELGVRWSMMPDPRKTARSSNAAKPPAAVNTRENIKKAAPATPAYKHVVTTSMFDEIPSGNETLEVIKTDLGDCRRCKLAPGRKNIVFGSGNPHAQLMFVGEAPGADEDEQGLPFVGRAGQLLTKIIEAIDMCREDVYICNILKCRPPGNRNPETDEIASCQPFLFRQIASVKPKVICTLGTFGTQTLLRTTEPISRIRGQMMDYRGVKLMATFHPAYLLRNPQGKRKVWEDVQKIRDYLRNLKTGD